MQSLIACFAGILLLGNNNATDPAKKVVTCPTHATQVKLTTSDKLTLKGDLLLPTNTSKQYPRSAAVILVHSGEGCRSDWWNLQGKISNWGAVTLALDLRGHGESAPGYKSGTQVVNASAKKNEDGAAPLLNPIQEDIKAAVAFLRKQKTVDPNRISVIGVDVSAAAAIRYAVNDLSIKGVGFISAEAEIPNFNLQDEAKKLGTRQLMLLAPVSAKDATEGVAQKLQGTVNVAAFVVDGEAKGMDLFTIFKTTEPKLTTENALKLWLRDLGALTPGP